MFTLSRTAVFIAFLTACAGCGSQAAPGRRTLPPTRLELLQVVEIDAGILDNDSFVPALSGLKIRPDQKLRIRGRYRPRQLSTDVPVFAFLYFHNDENTSRQGAPSKVLEEDGEMLRFEVDIGPPDPPQGSYRLVLKAGGERVIGTGSVTISP